MRFQKIIDSKPDKVDNVLVGSKIQTILILLKERGIVNRIFNKAKLDDLATNSMMLVINEKTIKLISEISKKNLLDLGSNLEKKLIILISKTLTESGRKMVSNREY